MRMVKPKTIVSLKQLASIVLHSPQTSIVVVGDRMSVAIRSRAGLWSLSLEAALLIPGGS